jgi:hypothetical protein
VAGRFRLLRLCRQCSKLSKLLVRGDAPRTPAVSPTDPLGGVRRECKSRAVGWHPAAETTVPADLCKAFPEENKRLGWLNLTLPNAWSSVSVVFISPPTNIVY